MRHCGTDGGRTEHGDRVRHCMLCCCRAAKQSNQRQSGGNWGTSIRAQTVAGLSGCYAGVISIAFGWLLRNRASSDMAFISSSRHGMLCSSYRFHASHAPECSGRRFHCRGVLHRFRLPECNQCSSTKCRSSKASRDTPNGPWSENSPSRPCADTCAVS